MVKRYNQNLEIKLTGAKVDELLTTNKVDVNLKEELQEPLFITLLQYTVGDIQARVPGMGEDDVFQAYRWICFKGTNFACMR